MTTDIGGRGAVPASGAASRKGDGAKAVSHWQAASSASVLVLRPQRPLSALRWLFASTTAMMALLGLPRPGVAGPVGGSVVEGAAGISQAGAVTTINQSSNRAIINWQGFSVGKSETVNFNQPSAASATLNRVTGSDASVIAGSLNANGQVFLVNPNGVLFSKGSQVNVGGLVASTLDISNANFMAGRYVFEGSSSAAVVNQGRLHARDGGYISLLGKTVSNDGVIAARLGTVAMASGERITLNFDGNSLLDVTIDKGALNALVENKRAIKADGGTVILTAKAADQILSAQVNNSGVIQARTMASLKGGSGSTAVAKTGKIKLLADGGTVNVSGKLDASAPKKGDGGFIETSGDKVKIADDAVITTRSATGKNGTWLIDPTDFTIYSGSGDQTSSGIGATTLQNELANGDVTIVTSASGTASGDINVNAALTWTSGNDLTFGAYNNINVNAPVTWSAGTLTLNAGANVYVNAVMTATGTANFAANYGHVVDASGNSTAAVTGTGINADGFTPYGLYTLQSTSFSVYTGTSFFGKINFSGSGTVNLNGQAYTVINNSTDLANVASGGDYVLGGDVTYSGWTTSIGTDAQPYTGQFNGFGHQINIGGESAGFGLFGTIGSGGVISNLYASGTTTSNAVNTGSLGLFADVNKGSILNSLAYNAYGGVTVSGTTVANVGGFVGDNSGLIVGSWAAITIAGNSTSSMTNVGGFVGLNEASGSIYTSSIWKVSASYNSTESASSTVAYAGGFAGVNAGLISRSYANAVVTLDGSAQTNAIEGDFVGFNTSTGTIDQAYVTFPVYGTSSGPILAGFVGNNAGTISNSYTTTPNCCQGGTYSAGFAYENSGTISASYAIASSNAAIFYGFVKTNSGTTTNDYYYATGGGTITDGLTSTATALAQSNVFGNYAGFSSMFWSAGANGTPILIQTPVLVNQSSAVAYGSSIPDSLSTQGLQGGDSTSQFIVATSPSGYLDVGSYAAGSVLTSATYKNIRGEFAITPAVLTLASGVVSDKTYDGTTTGTVDNGLANGGLVGLVGNQTLNINYSSAIFSDANAGTNKSVVVTYTIGDGTNGGILRNYTIATTTTATITPLTLSASFGASDKTYDGTTAATVTTQLPGVIGTDDVVLNYSSALFSDPNAGANKTVTLSGLTLTGTSAGNYALQATTIQSTATISPLALNLYGTETAATTTGFAAANLFVKNLVQGDYVSLSGSVTLAGTGSGIQPIVSFNGATVNNPNYTLVGATGSVVVGTQSLALENVVSGTVNFTFFGNTTIVNQTTNSAIINWLRFNIASNETVDFVQPSPTAVVLNRVTGNEQSVIAGAMNANGRVFIINPNGVLFSSTSQVNVGALVATTLNTSDNNFSAGNYAFSTTSGSGTVVNQGSITTRPAGFIVLASSNGVTNSGSLTAAGGTVALASVKNLTLVPDPIDNALGSYTITNLSGATAAGGTINVAATSGNGGLLVTAGNTVDASGLTLNTGTNGTWSYVQNGDILVGYGETISAQAVEANLAIRNLSLTSMQGTVSVNDQLSWSSGNLTLAGTNVTINDTVSWSGGTLTLGAQGLTNFINVNDVMTASITANLVVTYNTALDTSTSTITGVRQPSSTYGTPLGGINPLFDPTSGTFIGRIDISNTAAGALKINGQTYTLITSMSQLDGLDGYNAVTGTGTASAVSGNYALAMNLDASSTTYQTALIQNFTGNLEGLGHTISNLTIVTAGNVNYVGLIGTAGSTSPANVSDTVVRDIGIVKVAIDDGGAATVRNNGGSIVGPLVGLNNGTVINAFATGNNAIPLAVLATIYPTTATTPQNYPLVAALPQVAIAGKTIVGGLVGENQGTIANSHASVDIYGQGTAGGLVGASQVTAAFPNAVITNSYATGAVYGGVTSPNNSAVSSTTMNVGGFVGKNTGSVISNSYATGDVTTLMVSNLGGFAGYNTNSSGGLIGALYNDFSSGSVTAYWQAISNPGQNAGGLVGQNDGLIVNGVSTSKVSVLSDVPGFRSIYFDNVGALVGENSRGVFTQGYQGNYQNSDASGTPTQSYVNDSGTITTIPPDSQNQGLAGWNSSGASNTGTYTPGTPPSSTTQSRSEAAALAAVQRAADARAQGEGNNSTAGGGTGTGSNGAGNGTGGGTLQTAGQSAAQQAAAAQAAGAIVASATTQASSSPVAGSFGSNGFNTSAPAKLDDNITIQQSALIPTPLITGSTDRDRRRRTASSRGRKGGGSNLGATIRSIEVDGQRFDLQAPAQGGAPGSSGKP
jgi:filamentous hemagglutinin family protein